MELICFKCQTKNSVYGKVGRKDECTSCGMDLHSCQNCHFYDGKVYNSCKEPAADVVKDKERSNFCDFYQPSTGDGQKNDQKSQLKAAAEALFKK
jgi:hypothetical protein